jgi:EAL domain-containing protein (putative c-di-GMP-specific phosphodiesterase class I)
MRSSTATSNFFRQLGIRIAIDDAGSGYSSLNQIARIKPDYVKLDALMVRDIDSDTIQAGYRRRLRSVLRIRTALSFSPKASRLRPSSST